MASLASPSTPLADTSLAPHKTPPTSPPSSSSYTPISSCAHLCALTRDVASVHLFLQSLTSRLSLLPTSPSSPSTDSLFLHDLRDSLHTATTALQQLHSRYPDRLTAATAPSTAFSTATTPASHRSTSSSAFTTPHITDSPLALHTPFLLPTATTSPLIDDSVASNDGGISVSTRLRFTLSPSTNTSAASATAATSAIDPANSSASLIPEHPISSLTPSVPVSHLFRKILRTPAKLPGPSFTDSDDDDDDEDHHMGQRTADDAERPTLPISTAPDEASAESTRPSSPISQPSLVAGEEMEGGYRFRTVTPPPSTTPSPTHFTTPPHPSQERERSALLKLEEVKREIREREKKARSVFHDDGVDVQRGSRLDWDERLRLDPPAVAIGEVERKAFTDLLYDGDDDDPAEAERPTTSTSSPSPLLVSAGQRRRREEEGGAEGDGQGPSQRRVSPSTQRGLNPDSVPFGLPPALPRRFSSPSAFTALPASMIPALDALVAARLAAPPSPSPFTVRGSGQTGGRLLGTPHASPTAAGVFAPSVFSAPFVPLASHLNGALPLPSPFAFSPSPASSPARHQYSQEHKQMEAAPSPATRQLASLYSTLNLSPEGRTPVDALLPNQPPPPPTPSSGKNLLRTEWHGDSHTY